MTSEQVPTVELLKSAIETLLETANGVSPSDPFLKAQWEMSGAHAMIATGLLSFYQQATSIPPKKREAFVGYCLQWVAMISHHHHWEETKYYPMFRAEFDAASLIAEHKPFHDGIDKVENYLTSCLTIGDPWGYGQVVTASRKRLAVDPIVFDGRYLRDIIDTFVVSLVHHLQNEIICLRPEALRGSGVSAAEMTCINDATTKYFAGQPKTTLHVYAVLHTPLTSDFPPTPPFLKSFLVPYVLYGFHRQWWQFAPRRK